MANTKPGTSLLAQTEDKKKKWGGDIYNYDINGVIKGYDSAFAEYNAEGTSQERKDAINALYGGDITKWDNKNAYTAYMDDLNEVKYIDSLNKAYTASMDAAKDAEQRKTQYVDTRRMLMQKYLPDTLQAQGLANTGYVADTLLKAENICPLRVVDFRNLHRITGVHKVHKINALYNSARIHIEARNDSLC